MKVIHGIPQCQDKLLYSPPLSISLFLPHTLQETEESCGLPGFCCKGPSISITSFCKHSLLFFFLEKREQNTMIRMGKTKYFLHTMWEIPATVAVTYWAAHGELLAAASACVKSSTRLFLVVGDRMEAIHPWLFTAVRQEIHMQCNKNNSTRHQEINRCKMSFQINEIF